MIRVLALTLGLVAPPALARTVPEAHVDRVVAVFLAQGCVIDPLRDGAQAERAAGLDTIDFSKAVAVLEARGEATMDDATFLFRLNHEDCP